MLPKGGMPWVDRRTLGAHGARTTSGVSCSTMFDRGVAVIVEDPRGRVLLLLRGPTAPWMPNRWNLPGGKIERGESSLEAAMRETREKQRCLYLHSRRSCRSAASTCFAPMTGSGACGSPIASTRDRRGCPRRSRGRGISSRRNARSFDSLQICRSWRPVIPLFVEVCSLEVRGTSVRVSWCLGLCSPCTSLLE